MKTLTALLTLCFAALAFQPRALAQDWQLRDICDLRKSPPAGRPAGCARLAADVLALLPEKAGPGNLALLADFSDNLEKAGAGWDNPCRDPGRCPDFAYSIRYAMVPRKEVTIPKDKVYTAYVCREGFSATGQDDGACRSKLVKVLREMIVRARKEGMFLALLKCGASEGEAVRPDGAGVMGFELMYAFVPLPGMISGPPSVPSAVSPTDPALGARQPLSQIAASAAAPAQEARKPAPQGAQPPVPAQVPTPAPAPAPAQPPVYPPELHGADGEVVFQVAALPTLVQAEAVADRLASQGVETSFEQAQVNGRDVYRVLARSSGSPEALRRRLAELGYPGAFPRR
ncbi:hypothetical protein NNJEOMEG_01285 [Fundidesulfovibrio magnetotacticus]|uniref:SPOR domain-containing protein n=1 Tax=Fundidesulfovibrio magnetotacticus TaxID=2730080 RepID=A0A6V8LL98_9BACT|nr:SPOR domain-containing protein [Fundidesulfovibrio magnetotacticus]GFK93452.1 hypothetical protein NNJEOMEG_01285 [Fundidesulfovibrio magnetotacticus]